MVTMWIILALAVLMGLFIWQNAEKPTQARTVAVRSEIRRENK